MERFIPLSDSSGTLIWLWIIVLAISSLITLIYIGKAFKRGLNIGRYEHAHGDTSRQAIIRLLRINLFEPAITLVLFFIGRSFIPLLESMLVRIFHVMPQTAGGILLSYIALIMCVPLLVVPGWYCFSADEERRRLSRTLLIIGASRIATAMLAAYTVGWLTIIGIFVLAYSVGKIQELAVEYRVSIDGNKPYLSPYRAVSMGEEGLLIKDR